MAKQEKSGLEIIENAEALKQELNKAEGFLKNNQKFFTIVGSVVLAIALGIVGYNYWTKSQDADAQAAMYQSVFAFEKDSLATALKGDGANEGLLSVADSYGMSPSGKLANFYAGVALMKQGKYDEAIVHLKAFDSNDMLVQARAYCLIGDAYLEKKSVEDAITYYKKAIDYKPNKFFTPSYMMKLATAQEVAKDNKSALDTYNSIITDYPEAQEVVPAKKFKAKLEGIAGE
jgi:TolA-binding protein